jgi:hypothetical protein
MPLLTFVARVQDGMLLVSRFLKLEPGLGFKILRYLYSDSILRYHRSIVSLAAQTTSFTAQTALLAPFDFCLCLILGGVDGIQSHAWGHGR